MRLPYLKFYTRDWQADNALRLCSLGARGLWIEMICLMNQAARRGYLEHCGTPLTEQQIAMMVGGVNGEVIPLLKELEAAGVFSRDDRGCIYSRRIVEEEAVSEHARKVGAKGGNPALKKKRRVRIQNPEPIAIATDRLTHRLTGGITPPFTKPTASDIEAYGSEIGFKVNGNHFYDYYEARGWMAGKVKMKDWRAAVRTWKRNELDRNGGSHGGQADQRRAEKRDREYVEPKKPLPIIKL